VPTCPGWTLRQLITHVGRTHRWAAAIVATRAAAPVPHREVPDGRLPGDPAAWPAWLRDGAARLAGAVHGAGPGPVWTHLGPGPASYWARRRAPETGVHRADGQLAAGTRPVIDPDIAADGVAEWLGFLAPGTTRFRPEDPVILPEGKVVHLHATDADAGEWIARGVPGGITAEPGHGRGDAVLRGPASALLLVLVRRLPPGDPEVEVIGDRALLDAWLAATPF
jgi:uncharacterized protein (TIGR03083 family)